jgi:hypothetical protein
MVTLPISTLPHPPTRAVPRPAPSPDPRRPPTCAVPRPAPSPRAVPSPCAVPANLSHHDILSDQTYSRHDPLLHLK